MARSNTMSLNLTLAIGAAGLCVFFGNPVFGQTQQQPTTAPATTPTTPPGSTSMPMQQMEHGQGMGGMTGQGHPGPMMGGQGKQMAPMGNIPPCPPGQTATENPPGCK